MFNFFQICDYNIERTVMTGDPSALSPSLWATANSLPQSGQLWLQVLTLLWRSVRLDLLSNKTIYVHTR